MADGFRPESPLRILAASMVDRLGKMSANTAPIEDIRIGTLPELVPDFFRDICVPSDFVVVVHSHLQKLPLGIITDRLDECAVEAEHLDHRSL